MYLVIRIRGTTGVKQGIASTLEMLRLNRISHAVLVDENPSYKGMLQKAKDYITWGEVDLETLTELVEKRELIANLRRNLYDAINAEFISKMKDGAFLINTARGGLLDEQAVADALTSGKLAGAAVDVVTEEPMKTYNPLLSCPNCIITPHIAWAGVETRHRLMGVVADNLRHFIDGNPINRV